MKKITFFIIMILFAFTVNAQLVDRIPDLAGTALISITGDDGTAVYSGDDFTLATDVSLGELDVFGRLSTIGGFDGGALLGLNVFIYTDLAGVPNGDPTQPGTGVVELINIDPSNYTLEEDGTGNANFMNIDLTAANGGTEVMLTAGDYWMVVFPSVVGAPGGNARWNWIGSLDAAVGSDPQLIDPFDLFGAGATSWTGIPGLIGAPFNNFGWQLREPVLLGDGLTCETPFVATPGVTISDAGPTTGAGASNVCHTGSTNASWYTYTATVTGTALVSSDSDTFPGNSGLDTRVGVLNNDCDNLACIADDDDAGAGNTAVIEFDITAGETYLIEWVDRWSSDPFEWSITEVGIEDGLTCGTAFVATPGVTISDAGPTTGTGASNVCHTGSTNASWYTYTATIDGTALVSSDSDTFPGNSGLDTRVGVLNNDCDNLACIADDDDAGAGNTAVIEFDITAGETYLIEWVDRWSSDPFEWSITEIPTPACAEPTNLNVSGISDVSANVGWTAGIDGETMWDIEYGAPDFVPGNGEELGMAVGTTDNPYQISGLTASTDYEFYVRAGCTMMDHSEWVGPFGFTTLSPFIILDDLTCNDNYYDTGGQADAYQSDEFVSTTIFPNTAGEVVTVTFTYVDIETSATDGGGIQDGCWDFLTVYDGPDRSSPVLAATLCGEESGDGGVSGTETSVLSIGDSFTSTHASGALTFVFTSDGTVTETGWEADVTCSTVSVADNVIEGFEFYPNPAKNRINLTALNTIDNVEVFNMVGQKVLSENLNTTTGQLDISNLSTGMYVMKVTSNNQVGSYQIVKK